MSRKYTRSLSDDDWLINAIETARSKERLEFLKQIISEDKARDAGYTQDKNYMDRLRQAWNEKKELVK